MKIAIIADALDNQYAGIHVFTRALILALHRVGSEHELIVVRTGKGGPELDISDLRIPAFGGRLGQIYRLGWQVPRLLRRLGADVVIEPRHVGPFNLPRRTLRVTVVHDLGWLTAPHFHPTFPALLQRLLVPLVLRRTDLVVTNSHWTAQDVQEHFPSCKQKTIAAPLGLTPGFAPRQDPDVLHKYGIREPYLLFVCTLEPRKNIKGLLEAYTQARKLLQQPISLVLAGKMGWKTGSIKRALRQHPYRQDIIHVGYVEARDLPVLYTMAKALVYPSWYEGFGLPVLESFGCGTPVITSNVTSLPEVAGDAALLVDPADAGAIARSIVRVIEDAGLRQKLIDRGRERAAGYTWDRTARIILEGIQQRVL
jgi:glycosyltransferase involved in cell wall biosynthesis